MSSLWYLFGSQGLCDAVYIITIEWLVQDRLSKAESNAQHMINAELNHQVPWAFEQYLLLLLSQHHNLWDSQDLVK